MGFPYKRTGSFPTDAKSGGGAFTKFDNYNAAADGQLYNAPGELPKWEATGGTKYDGPNGLTYHVFTPSNPAPQMSLAVTTASDQSVYMLLVAGGGGGGNQHAGGGGAGALFYQEGFPLATGTFPVTIGGGGSGGTTTGATNNAAPGGDSSFATAPQPDQYVLVNGGGGGGGMEQVGKNGGSGGGGGLRPGPGSGPIAGGEATGSPTHPGSPLVHAYDGGDGSDYEASSPAGGIGGGGGGATSLGASTPASVSPKGDWPASTGAVSPTNNYGQGGNDYNVPTTFMPTDVVLGLAAEMGSPTTFLGVPIAPTFSPTPYAATLLFAGGGGGGSHSPWGVFNNDGEYPTGGGGSGIGPVPGWGCGGVGGKGNADPGQPGVNTRGGGGGGSGGASNSGGTGGAGCCIVAYPT